MSWKPKLKKQTNKNPNTIAKTSQFTEYLLSSHQAVIKATWNPQHRGSCSGFSNPTNSSSCSRFKSWGMSLCLWAATGLLKAVWHQTVWAAAEQLPTSLSRRDPGCPGHILDVSSNPGPEADLEELCISWNSPMLISFKENILGLINKHFSNKTFFLWKSLTRAITGLTSASPDNTIEENSAAKVHKECSFFRPTRLFHPIFLPKSLSTSTQTLPKLSLLRLYCLIISQICCAQKYTGPLPTTKPELSALSHCSLKQVDFALACYNSSFVCTTSMLKKKKS